MDTDLILLIHLSLHMSCLIFGCNEFRKGSYASQALSAATRDIFSVANDKVTNKMTSNIHLYKD